MKSWKDLLIPIFLILALTAPALADDDDDAGEIRFERHRYEVSEDAGAVTILVERKSGEAGMVTVDYETVAGGGSAEEGADYTAVSGTLTWLDGDDGERSFEVPILADDLAEGDETIVLLLSNPTGGAELDDDDFLAQIVIVAHGGGDDDDEDSDSEDEESDDEDSDSEDEESDDEDSDSEDEDSDSEDEGEDDEGDSAGFFKFDEASFEVLEEAGMVTITVERSMGEDGVVSVDYATSTGGSATEGEDYTGVSGTLMWADGDGSDQTFVVPILDDGDPEGEETIQLVLSNPTGGAELDGERMTSVIEIQASDGGDDGEGEEEDDGEDDGSPGVLKFDEASFEVLEGAGMAIVTVERSQGQSGAVSVDYATFGDTAADGADFTGVSGTLSWDDGDGGNKTFLVPIADDAEDEGNESLDLELSNATGGATIDPLRGNSALTIIDDDSTTCQPDDNTMCLLGSRFKVEVAWQDFQGGSGPGRPMTLSDKSGLFWFFDSGNVEMLVKVLNGCRAFGSYWVFFSSTTNLDLAVTVTDTRSGVSKTYTNPLGQAAQPIQDVSTFTDCN